MVDVRDQCQTAGKGGGDGLSGLCGSQTTILMVGQSDAFSAFHFVNGTCTDLEEVEVDGI